MNAESGRREHCLLLRVVQIGSNTSMTNITSLQPSLNDGLTLPLSSLPLLMFLPLATYKKLILISKKKTPKKQKQKNPLNLGLDITLICSTIHNNF